MDCPHCGAENQEGFFCESCGGTIKEAPGQEESLIFDRFSSKQVIAFLSGAIIMLLLFFILFMFFGGDRQKNAGQPVVVSQGEPPEDAETKALREAAVMEAEAPEDAIVGYYRYYIDGIKIDKIDRAAYRMDYEGDLYRLKFNETQYVLEKDKVNYYFSLTPSSALRLDGADRPSGLEVKDPIFPAGFIASRVNKEGADSGDLAVNMDAFQIIGQTYGQLAGNYGPGALTVIGDNQFIIFNTSGGQFAVSFQGDTVPLSSQPAYRNFGIRPLAEMTGPVSPDNQEENSSDETDGEGQDSSNGASMQTPESVPQEPFQVEVPNMPTFPSSTAVASGVVWADLGYFIKNMPENISLSELSNIMGISFQTGSGSTWVNGYKIYGGAEGYFVANYGTDYGTFKVSGYGANSLHRDKTTIFIERIA